MLNQYFNRNEFACRCGCGEDTVDVQLLAVLTKVREHFGKPLIINSAHRCRKHNTAIGSNNRSQHVRGKAADIVVVGIDPTEVHKYLLDTYPDSFGIGGYLLFTHIDVRNKKARW